MDKVYKDIDGVTHVAVLYSPGYGAGWSTWNKEFKKQLIFEPTIVQMLEDGIPVHELERYITSTYPNKIYVGGAEQLVVKWLPKGTLFIVREYAGSEYIETITDIKWEVT